MATQLEPTKTPSYKAGSHAASPTSFSCACNKSFKILLHYFEGLNLPQQRAKVLICLNEFLGLCGD
jgi:hypothetical protein